MGRRAKFVLIWNFAVFCWLAKAGLGAGIPVGVFQPDGLFSRDSHMRNAEEFSNDLNDTTVCIRFRLQHLRGIWTYLLSYAQNNTDSALTVVFVDRYGVLNLETCRHKTTSHECAKVDMTARLEFMRWTHVCTTFGVEGEVGGGGLRSNVVTYLDGEEVARETVELDVFLPLSAEGVLVLGQDQDSPGAYFDADQAFSGEMSQVGMWDRVLDAQEIRSLANCEENIQGNQVDWEMTRWSRTEVDLRDEELEMLCQPHPLLRKFFITDTISYDDFKATCTRLGGELPVVRSNDELTEIHSQVSDSLNLLKLTGDSSTIESADNCFVSSSAIKFNVGQRRVNGRWVDPYKNETLSGDDEEISNLRPVDEREECARSWGDKLETQDCDVAFACGVCFLPAKLKLMLKGVCDGDAEREGKYDRDYYIYGQKNGKPYFRGIRNSHIFFSPASNRWQLQSLRDPSKFLNMSDKIPEVLPIGTHDWISASDVALCGKDPPEKHELTFSRCFPNMYSCDSGDCIPLSHRCNTEIDCVDKSDEYHCAYLNFGPNYAKELIPRDESGQPVVVKMNVSILAFPEIDTVNLKFTTDFFLNLRWYDARVDFKDLNNFTSLNSLSEIARDSIWTPQLAFVNALGPFQTVADEMTSGVLIREGQPLKEDLSLSTEAMLFAGGENSIMINREYYQDYGCDFNLKYYPFDTQMCKMVFSVQGKTDNYVKLEEDGMGIEFLGGRVLVEYEIQMERLKVVSRNNISQAEVQIVFRRRMEFHVTNTFLQTLILIMVGYMSYYFEEDNFTDRIMVTLTTMLVIVVITSSIQAGLPKTSYYKLLDWWLFFSSNALAITMAFHTYVAYLCSRARRSLNLPGGDNGHEARRRRKSVFFKTETRFVQPRPSADDGQPKQQQQQQQQQQLDKIKEQQQSGAGHRIFPDVSGSAEDLDPLRYAKRFNTFGKVVYVVTVVVFNIVFWIVALTEFVVPAEEYLD